MEQLKRLPLGRQLILGAGVLLLIDTFLDWQQVSTSFITAGRSAWHGFWGIVMCLALIVLLVWALARVFGVALPVQVPDGLATLGLAALILLFAIIKVLSDSYVHWPAYVGIILAAAVGYGAWLVFQTSGESLPSIPRAAATGGGASSPPEPPASESSSDPV
ncbi:MAG TPA: hypothetical protein VKR23_07280 [Gaiellaceae bacterium]|nr:hypothetical protein [Gaiellaceae bacterium]